jgi:uncharacterized protein (TIGR03546 family)
MFLILRPLRLLLSAMIFETTPRQKSMGLAFGILIGLVPKGNLLAISLGFILAATRLNLAVAALGAMLAATIAVSCDSLFDQIGWYVLSQPSLAGTWTWLYDVPWVPWTDFDNSIVMGSFVTGLVLMLPVHFATRPLFQRYSGVLSMYAKRSWLLRVMTGAEVANRLSAVE